MKGVSWIVAAAMFLTACSPPRSPDDAFVAAADRLRPSVVLLTMNVPGESKKSGPDTEYATGTVVAGGAWGSDILTVEHALEGAWNLRVTVENRRKYPFTVVARNGALDIALVRTRVPGLSVAQLGSSADARPGRSIGIIGYPIPDQFESEGLGLATSINSGLISALRGDAIEVTLPIVPGESGGPIFLSDTGEVIGVAESRFEDERSIGFALPINAAKHFLRVHDSQRGF